MAATPKTTTASAQTTKQSKANCCRATKTTRQRAISNRRAHGIRNGYRSGLEEKVAEDLAQKGVDADYESTVIRYIKPERTARYTPDFVLPNAIVIETKGRFLTADRQKHLLIKKQHPGLDVRFIFSNARARISKTSRTTYADWCDKHGFIYAQAPTAAQARKGAPWVPEAWLNEGTSNEQ